MTEFFRTLLLLSAAGSVLGLLLMLARRISGKRLPSTLWYYAWLPVLLRLALPLPGLIPGVRTAEKIEPEPATVQAEMAEENALPWGDAAFVPSALTLEAIGKAAPEAPAETRIQWGALLQNPGLWLAVWLTGAALCFARYAVGYLRFRRTLLRTLQTTDGRTARVYKDLAGQRKPRLLCSAYVATPMLLGLFRPLIVLPRTDFSEESAANILRHELTHFRRGDLFVKWFFVLTASLHWFNPLMPLFRRELDRVCELSCDETVLARMEPSQRQSYGETLLDLAANRTLPAGVVATTFATEKRVLRERLEQIMKFKHKPRAILALSLAALVLVGAAALAAGPARAAQAPTDPPEPMKEVSPEFPGASESDAADASAAPEENDNAFTVDNLYQEEVDRELADFAHSGRVEVNVTETFDETLPEDDIFGPLTLEDYIYGTDSWEFSYQGEFRANNPEATIIVRDADGRSLWIMDDADELYIEEMDGSTTRLTYAGDPVDCADMIRHLLPWARGEYRSEEELRAERAVAAEAALKAALAELGYYGLPDLEPVNMQGGEATPFWASLSELPTGPYVTLFYGTDELSIDLHYERVYADDGHTRPLGAGAYEQCRSFFAGSEGETVTDVPRDSIRAFVSDGVIYYGPRIVWYDEANDLLFSMIAHHCDGGQPLGSYTTEELIALAQSVSRQYGPAFALLSGSEKVVSARISGFGKTVEVTDAETLEALLNDMCALSWSPADEEITAPGGIVLAVVLTTEDGTEAELTYPLFEYDGAVYACDPQVVTVLGAYLEEDEGAALAAYLEKGEEAAQSVSAAPAPAESAQSVYVEPPETAADPDDRPGQGGETPIDYLMEYIPEEYWPAGSQPDNGGETTPD